MFKLIFKATKNLDKNSHFYFYSYKPWKNKSGSYLHLLNYLLHLLNYLLHLLNYLLHFRLSVSSTKNQIYTMIYIRLSGFWFNKTGLLFLGNDEQHYLAINSFLRQIGKAYFKVMLFWSRYCILSCGEIFRVGTKPISQIKIKGVLTKLHTW